MAIYHFSTSLVKRSVGRSVVAAAAWQRGVDLLDQRVDRACKFSKRGPGVWSDILLPEGADSAWRDPFTLWNTVEIREKRKDAQLARCFQLALPTELAVQENIDLVVSFVQRVLVKEGMVADATIRLTTETGKPHPFAVVMATLRSVVAVSGVAEFGNKVLAWNDRRSLACWRKEWCDEVNAALASAGHDARVDHRSFAEREVCLEPQINVGVIAKKRHERGLFSERLVENDAIIARRRASSEDKLVCSEQSETRRTHNLRPKSAQVDG